MATQKTRTARTKKERAKAEDTIAKATAEAKANVAAGLKANGKAPRTKRTPGEWPCTAEQIEAERDGKGLSWAQVAVNLELGSPGRARTAYTELTGRPHHESQMTGRRAPRGAGPRAAQRKVDAPNWNDDSDQGEIEDRLNESTIYVQRKALVEGAEPYVEEVVVRRVTEFSFGKKGDQPLQVFLVQETNGASRAFNVADIIEVR